MIRLADGKFEVAFYIDAGRTKETLREKGSWWVKGNEFFTQTQGVATSDGYAYSFVDADTVHFTVLKRDPSADCQADYQFSDHRVTGARK